MNAGGSLSPMPVIRTTGSVPAFRFNVALPVDSLGMRVADRPFGYNSEVYTISLLGILLLSAPQSAGGISHTVTIDTDHTLLVIGGRMVSYPAMGEYGTNLIYVNSGERLKLAISEKSALTWELGDASIEIGEQYGRIARASVVRLQPTADRVCAYVKAGESAFASCGDEASQTIVAQLGPSDNLPEPLAYPLSDSHSPIPEPLPQSTYDEFARARPDRGRNGYTRNGTNIDERISAHQVIDHRIWFGTAFYHA